MKILPVILSGGAGTRLWPMSRASYPKQLQQLHGTGSLLQQTAKRLSADEEILSPVVICNAEQRFVIAEQLGDVGVAPSQIILEPVGRNTAPALAVAAMWAKEKEQTVMVVMPSDHYIADIGAFKKSIRQAAELAIGGKLMTLGIRPTKPHTGFGYIEKGKDFPEAPYASVVNSFKEKPDAATAQAYLNKGNYFWNSGIFIFRADVYLSELARLQPKIIEACQASLDKGRKDLDFLRLDEKSFEASPNISIDYAVMEHAKNVGVVPVDFGWSDVGGWAALWELGKKDASNNVVHGDVILQNVKDLYVRSESRLVSVLGLENIVVVDTADALLIANKNCADNVKDVVAQLKKDDRTEGHSHERVWRPWGFYEMLDKGSRFQVKQIMVKPKAKLSLQMHHHRTEHWVIVNGTARVTCGDKIKLMGPDESIYIPLGQKHQLENPGKVPLYLIEIQSGDYLGEDDIIRFDDVYGRE